MNAYRILGTSDDHDTCELCGRTGLKRTIALEERATGAVVYYGTDCAARATGWSEHEIRVDARAADRERGEREHAERSAKMDAEHAAFIAWLAERAGTTPEAVQAEYRETCARLFGSPLKALSAYSAERA